MKAPSLHLRLMLGGSVAILAAVAVAWLAMIWLFERHVERRETAELTRSGMLLAGAAHVRSGAVALEPPPLDPRFLTPASGLYWQVAYRGQALRSRSLWDQGLDQAPAGGEAWRTRTVPGPFGKPLLTVDRTIRLPGGEAIQVAVAADAEPLTAARAEFTWELAGFMAVLWLVLSGAAVLQVRLGLQPLAALRGDLQRMKRSSAARLSEGHPGELSPLVGEINALADSRQTDIDRARRRAADLAHSLKTPLAALSAQSRRAREQGASDAADGLDRAVAQVGATLEAELARSRAAAARDDGAQRTSRPAEIAERLFSVIERTEDGERIVLSQTLAPELEAPVSPDVLMELLGPLLENATRHARRMIRLSGDVTAEGGVRLDVEDDGPGLSADRAEAALMRGGRLDEAGPGHGLGLAIARDLVEATDGRLSLAQSALGGLMVSLEWPRGR